MADQAKIAISGRIHTIFPAEINGSFESRMIWLEETTERYPQTFAIQFTQGNCNLLDRYAAGDVVEIGVNLRGRHWVKDGREGVFNTLQGWRINLKAASGTSVSGQSAANPIHGETQFSPDDLPF